MKFVVGQTVRLKQLDEKFKNRQRKKMEERR